MVMFRLLKLLLLFSCFVVSCRSKNKVEQQLIEGCDRLQRVDNLYTTIDLENAEERAYTDFIDSIRYIPLGDECGVMGNIANIITYKGRFYIQEDRFDRVFIYDDAGRCLKKIDNKEKFILYLNDDPNICGSACSDIYDIVSFYEEVYNLKFIVNPFLFSILYYNSFIVRFILSWSSMSVTFTVTFCPICNTSSTFFILSSLFNSLCGLLSFFFIIISVHMSWFNFCANSLATNSL